MTNSDSPTGNDMEAIAAHRAKMAQWLRMSPTETRELAEAILTSFVPFFEAAGFQEVASWYGEPKMKVTGRELRLERWLAETIDSVHIAFEKYRTPRLAISLARRNRANPLEILRGAFVTRSRGQYYRMWGKPWWLPLSLWPSKAPISVVDELMGIVPQLLLFLDQGERGPNIGRSVNGIAY